MVRLRPGETFDERELLAPDAAVAAFHAAVALPPPRAERVPLDASAGRILAVDIAADADHPAAARSTMDGFAVRAEGPPRRRIVGSVRMGTTLDRPVGPDEAVRIPTGGVVPAGADAVVPIEDVRESDGEIALPAPVAPGACVTPAGSDMRRGEVVLPRGRRIGAPELGVLATVGIVEVPVVVPPRLAILSTGDELVDPAQTPALGAIRDSNRYAIAGAARAFGFAAVHAPRVADEVEPLRAALAAALADADAVVLSGGSSVGARDLTPHVIDALGAPGPVVHGLAVKPGKPTVLGAVGAKPVIGLPGNPTSALTIFLAVARPALAPMLGVTLPVPAALTATETIAGRVGWTYYVPVRIGGDGCVAPLPIRSAHTTLLARADGFGIVGPAGVVKAGERLPVVTFVH